MSVRGLKIAQNLLNTFQTTLFRTSACRRQPSWIWKESLATALLTDIDFHVWKLLTVNGVRSLCASLTLRGTEIGVNFTFYFQSVINITTLLGRQDMKLFSTVIFIETESKTQEIRQWKSLKLDQFSYMERSWEHFGLPTWCVLVDSQQPFLTCKSQLLLTRWSGSPPKHFAASFQHAAWCALVNSRQPFSRLIQQSF